LFLKELTLDFFLKNSNFLFFYVLFFGTILPMKTIPNHSLEYLQKEIAELKNNIEKYETVIKERENAIKERENAIKELQEELEWFKRQIFGKRSEKIIPHNENQLEFDGFGNLQKEEKEDKKTVTSYTRRKQKKDGADKITLPNNLPIKEEILDLSEKEKVCPETGTPLKKIGEEITYKLAYKPGNYFLKKFIRFKYAFPNMPDKGIVEAAPPESLLGRCLADESLLADIMVKKYADHLPLYRQSEIRARENIKISRQTLSMWIIKAGLALKPLYTLMKNKILESGNIFVDETPVKLLDPGRGKTKESYVWVLVGGKVKDPPYRIYQFFENRNHCNAKDLLKNFKGTFHSDKYGAYEKLANQKPYTWCPCMVHCRRKFFDVQSGDLEFKDRFLKKIQKLYEYEETAWQESPENRLQIRKEKEEPIINEMIKMAKTKLNYSVILPKSNLMKAIKYFCGLIPYLKNYLRKPFARLDNNIAERAIRPLAIGRKNYLFFGSFKGGEASGIIYSLVQTCRNLDINPHDYLEDVI
jgi:transposase